MRFVTGQIILKGELEGQASAVHWWAGPPYWEEGQRFRDTTQSIPSFLREIKV